MAGAAAPRHVDSDRVTIVTPSHSGHLRMLLRFVASAHRFNTEPERTAHLVIVGAREVDTFQRAIPLDGTDRRVVGMQSLLDVHWHRGEGRPITEGMMFRRGLFAYQSAKKLLGMVAAQTELAHRHPVPTQQVHTACVWDRPRMCSHSGHAARLGVVLCPFVPVRLASPPCYARPFCRTLALERARALREWRVAAPRPGSQCPVDMHCGADDRHPTRHHVLHAPCAKRLGEPLEQPRTLEGSQRGCLTQGS